MHAYVHCWNLKCVALYRPEQFILFTSQAGNRGNLRRMKDMDSYKIAQKRIPGPSQSGKLKCQMLQRIKETG